MELSPAGAASAVLAVTGPSTPAMNAAIVVPPSVGWVIVVPGPLLSALRRWSNEALADAGAAR